MTNQDLYDYVEAKAMSAPSGDIFAVGCETEAPHFVDKGGNPMTPDEALNRYGLTHEQVETFIAARPKPTHTYVGTGVLSDAAPAPVTNKASRFFSRK